MYEDVLPTIAAYGMNPKPFFEVTKSHLTQLKKVFRISPSRPSDCDSNICLMEVFIMSYIYRLRKKIGVNEWPLQKPVGPARDLERFKFETLYTNYGLLAMRHSFKADISFGDLVKQALHNRHEFEQVVYKAQIFMP